MQWRALIPVAVVSAVLGCAAAVGIVQALHLGGGHTTTVVQQAPLRGQAASSSDEGGLTPRDIYKRAAPGVVFIRAQVVEQTPSPFESSRRAAASCRRCRSARREASRSATRRSRSATRSASSGR